MASAKSNGAGPLPLEKYSPGVVFVGAGACCATIMSLLMFPNARLEGMAVYADKALVVLAMAVMFLIYFLFSHSFSSLRGELHSNVASLVGLVAFSLSSFAPIDAPAFPFVCDCIAAMGATSLVVIWFVDLCLRPRSLPVAHIAGAFAIAAAILVGEVLFDTTVRMGVQAGIWVLASVLSVAMYRHHARIDVPPVSFNVKEADARSRIKVESKIMMAAIYCQLGILIGTNFADDGRSSLFILLAALVASAFMTIDSATRKPVITERTLFSLTVPVTTTSLACIYLFGDGVVHSAALCLLMIAVVLYLALGSVALSSHVLLERLSPVRTIGKYRAVQYATLLAGVAIGVTIGNLYAHDPLWAARAMVIVALVYCFVGSFFHRVRTPDSTLRLEELEVPDVAKGVDHRIARCNELRVRYGLSARQYEVLCLISQGRNAEYVAEMLTISLSTVQTHVRNIYQKLGVHSRQELYDLIENTKLYGED